MRVLALGAAGAMGAAAVETAAGLLGVEQIVIADRDGAAAAAVARRFADARVPVTARTLDVTDAAALRGALSRADLVLNTVGPYYRFGRAVLRAAIDTGTHYLDICDDWEPTVDMLGSDQEARDAGVCAVVGMGASPGISNLLAALAADELDTVLDAYTAWPVDVPGAGADDALLTDGRPTAAAVHWMQQSSGTISAVAAGRLVAQRPLRAVELTLPGGRRGTAYTIGHPEPITLQRSLNPTGDAANLMVVTPWTLAYLEMLRRDIDAGLLTNEAAAEELASPSLGRMVRSVPTAMRTRGPGNLPPFFAALSGTRDGREYRVLAHLSPEETGGVRMLFGDMARATGIPLALGMSQVIDGSARRPGVHPPEAVIDARRFFADLGREFGGSAAPVVIEREPGGITAGRVERGVTSG
ncbi:saccharopine dehydrogenase family protein [Nocardia niigatensis]|uniref:saccharopine dehydrogenase family protein n=1 Tax=Nocardia niigatensis TaxID=209249 RepID=UPI0002E63A14|nr:saccharopine dehydrogenase NADP-binding domain-containing protein [Nocardia niigatensis]